MEFFEFTSVVEAFFFQDVYKQYLWTYLLIGGLCFAVVYIFQSIALYTIAGREGYAHRWMAFVPFFNTYYMGVLSQKNKMRNVNPKYLSLALAILEAVLVAMYILYYVAVFLIFSGGYAVPDYDTMIFGNMTVTIPSGIYTASGLPENLTWAWWVFCYMQTYVISLLNLPYIVLHVFVLFAFFRTYATSKYVVFAILSALFPIKGILMFVVRNTPGRNYIDYIREQQQLRYNAYQNYMRNNPNNPNNGYNGGGYNGYYQPPRPSAPEDPFGEFNAPSSNNNGGDSGNSGSGGNAGSADDPFDEFKN